MEGSGNEQCTTNDCILFGRLHQPLSCDCCPFPLHTCASTPRFSIGATWGVDQLVRSRLACLGCCFFPPPGFHWVTRNCSDNSMCAFFPLFFFWAAFSIRLSATGFISRPPPPRVPSPPTPSTPGPWRVTCRDWFQLTLKEGLTVYRDQVPPPPQFSTPPSSIIPISR